MPDTSLLSPYVVKLDGGLILNRDSFSMPPGAALELINFEPDISGGYRRINGFSKYNSNIVPQTSASTEKVLGVAIYKGNIIAARGEKVFKGGTTGSWTAIQTGRTSAERYSFVIYNFDNTEKIIYVDGVNNAAIFDNSSVTAVSTTNAPADPSTVALHKNHMFFAGMSSNPQEVVFSAPFSETDFSAANGAGSIKVDSAVVQLVTFRNSLYIFCEDQIHQLTGTSIADFQLQPVTRRIGCVSQHSVQELGGDIIYLAPDGLRTLAGTARIGDVELGTVSKQIQDRLLLTNISLDRISSTVIRNKSQYRIFFSADATVETGAKGVAAVLKQSIEGGNMGFEYADLQGIKPACMASGFIDNTETIVHGGHDGYIYKHDDGNTFDGTNIAARYRSPDLNMGDAGVRKLMQRIIWNYENEGTVDSNFRIRYDFNSSAVPQPAQYALATGGSAAIYGNEISKYGTAVYGSSGSPLIRQSVEGGGFTVGVRVDDSSGLAPFSIKGYQLEFTPGGRR